MKPLLMILLSILLSLACCVPSLADDPMPTEPSIAIVSKAIADVTKKDPKAKDWKKAKLGETLGSGDRIRTGERSIAIIKFKDNSLVRVRQRSELTVTGKMKGNTFSKAVNVDNGSVGFNVAKQAPEEEFRFTSPTSVASIRGTGGQFIMSLSGDTVTVLEGLVTLQNKPSSKSVEVGAGFTGLSNPDGTLFSRLATSDEKRSAEEAMKTGDQPMKLELDLRDGQGKTKSLRIDFK
jgi:hypothetical protein